MVANTATLKDNPDFGKALAGIWYETVGADDRATRRGQGGARGDGQGSGTDLAGLRSRSSRRPSSSPSRPTRSPSPTRPTCRRRWSTCAPSSSTRACSATGAPSADVIGIELPDGKVLGDTDNVKLRFTDDLHEGSRPTASSEVDVRAARCAGSTDARAGAGAGRPGSACRSRCWWSAYLVGSAAAAGGEPERQAAAEPRRSSGRRDRPHGVRARPRTGELPALVRHARRA